MDRMNREQFYTCMAALNDQQLRKALWNVYWRAAAPVRERIESELAPAEAKPSPRVTSVDSSTVLGDVTEFVSLARAGAYLGRDRRVRPKERSQWRFTFKRLLTESRRALLEDDESGSGAQALTAMIDLACEISGHDYFHSEDPLDAAGVVVSDDVALLWRTALDRSEFPAFAQVAAQQFVRWESPYGWSRKGYGKVSEKETSLTRILARMMPPAAAWATFAHSYLGVLDQLADSSTASSASARYDDDYRRTSRAEKLAAWNLLLLDQFFGTDLENLLDRLAGHAALGGPEMTFFAAQLAWRRGDTANARSLIQASLGKLPGHREFLDFAEEIGAPLPVQPNRW